MNEHPFSIERSLTHISSFDSFSRTDAMLKHRKSEHEQPKKEEASPIPKEKTAMAKRKASNLKLDKRPIDLSEASNIEATEDFALRYKVVKTKLSHILRENEMLNEEYLQATKKLKRLRTERRVLLDVLVAAEKDSQEKKSVAVPVGDKASSSPSVTQDEVQEPTQEAKEEEEADEEGEEVDELMDEDDDDMNS